MKLLLTLLTILITVVPTVAVIQIGAVYLLRFMQPDLKRADLVAIMSGANDRISYGCMIAAAQGSGSLMLINSTPQQLKKHAIRNHVPSSVTLLPGGTSRSTFEDIHVTVQTARDRSVRSVILVTSDYLLPRALFLTYIHRLAVGQEMGVQYMAVPQETPPQKRFRLFYSEIVKFWGSVAEMSGYHITGRLPLDSEKVRAAG